MDNRTPYKTAAELNIHQWEHDGLVALIAPLSRGELNYDQARDCGTAMCIGGWLAFFNGRKDDTSGYVMSFMSDVDEDIDENAPNRGYEGLAALYWGNTREDTTREQGSRAIVNFLVTGDPQWDAVMAEP